MDAHLVTQQLMSMHATLLGIQTSLVRHEELHNQLRQSLKRMEDLVEDHEARLRSLETARNQADGTSKGTAAAVAIAVSMTSGTVLYVLQRLFGG